MEELGGRRQPRHPLRRVPTSPPTRRARVPRAGARAALVPAARTTSTRPPYLATADADPDRARRRSSPTIIPDAPTKPYDMTEVIELVVDDGDFFEVAPLYAQNIVVGFARLDGHVGRRRRQPAQGAGRRARHRRLDQGRALRALLRRLQHPARHAGRRARLPARHHPGVRRHHPARRQAALRLRRGHRAQAHGHHAQGLRRRVRRHGQQARRRRLQRRLAHGRDRGDGRRRARSTSSSAASSQAGRAERRRRRRRGAPS